MNTLDGVAWEDLAVLLATVKQGSVSAAARTLRISQSTASRRLARLESALSVRLFDRTSEGVLPTDFAERLVPLARLVEGNMADIARLAHGEEVHPRGRVRLALPDGVASAWLLPMLSEFYDRYPEVAVDLVIGHAVVDLVRREADIALRFIPPTSPDLRVRKLGCLAIEPYARPDAARSNPQEMRWILFDDPDAAFVETQWVLQHVQPRWFMQVSLWNALFAAVSHGLGAAMLSPTIAQPAGLVRVCEDLPPPPERVMYLVYHRALRSVPRVAVLRDWLVEKALELLRSS